MARDTHNLFGDLWLEPPELFLNNNSLEEYNRNRPFIDQLSRLQNSSFDSNSDDDLNFDNFKAQEINLWAERGVKRDPAHLVAPSGQQMSSKICHHLHVPSFTTHCPENGEVADRSSPCTAVIMESVSCEYAVFIDHTLRREIVQPLRYYLPQIYKCHEEYVMNYRRRMRAKVEVIYGEFTQKRLRKILNLTPLHLWGQYKGLTLWLEWDTEGEGRILRRFLLFAMHPESFLKGGRPEWRTRQDMVIAVGAQLAGVEFVVGYYEQQLYRPPASTVTRFANTKQMARQSKLVTMSVYNQGLPVIDRTPEDQVIALDEAQDCFETGEGIIRALQDNADGSKSFLAPKLGSMARKTLSKVAPNWLELALSQDQAKAQGLPNHVICWCVACKENTVFRANQRGNARLLDDSHPYWTNEKHPRYIEGQRKCLNCGSRVRYQPRDEHIASIDVEALRDAFNGRMANLRLADQVSMLSSIPNSIRTHRKQKVYTRSKRAPDFELERGAKKAPIEDKVNPDGPMALVKKVVVVDRGRAPVAVKCLRCGQPQREDIQPEFHIETGEYLAYLRQDCSTLGCLHKSAHFVPQDKAMPCIKYNTLSARLQKQQAK